MYHLDHCHSIILYYIALRCRELRATYASFLWKIKHATSTIHSHTYTLCLHTSLTHVHSMPPHYSVFYVIFYRPFNRNNVGIHKLEEAHGYMHVYWPPPSPPSPSSPSSPSCSRWTFISTIERPFSRTNLGLKIALL